MYCCTTVGAFILITLISYVVGIYGFKMSLLLSYMRVFPGNYRIAAIVVAAIISMAHIAFICVSVKLSW